MVNMLHRKTRVNDDIGFSKVVTSGLQARNIENRQTIRRSGITSVQGGIALTNPPCIKKQTSNLTKRPGLFIKRTAKWLS